MGNTQPSSQNAQGSFIAQALGKGAKASVTIYEAPKPCIPLQRPPRVEHFTGRKRQLTQLLADLQPGKVVTLCGPGGIGKTALAAEAIWQLAPDENPPVIFPDGVIFHSFYEQPQASLALEHIARSFGEEPKPTPSDAALRVLAGRKALLILDGTEDTDDLTKVLGTRGNCGVLLTSRTTQDAVSDWQDLPPLDIDESVQLLQEWCGEQIPNEATAIEICKLVGRLPLAVLLVGRYVAQRKLPAATFLDWLKNSPLEALTQGRRREQSIPLLIEESLNQVSEAARKAIALAGFLSLAPFGCIVVETTFELAPFKVKDILGELISYGLLLQHDDRYQVSHALIHTYAQQRLFLSTEIIDRIVAYYEKFIRDQIARGSVGLIQLDVERSHILQVLAGVAKREAWASVLLLVQSVEEFLTIRAHSTERINANEIGLAGAKALGRPQDEWVFVSGLGHAYQSIGEMERATASYKQALEISQNIKDRRGEGISLGNLGGIFGLLGKREQEFEFHMKALDIAQEINDKDSQIIQLGALGIIYGEIGQPDKDIEFQKQALIIAREINNRYRISECLNNLAISYMNLSQMDSAISHLNEALTIDQEDTGNERGEAGVLINLGLAYYRLKQMNLARERYEQALTIMRKLGDQVGSAICLTNLGNLFVYQPEPDYSLARQCLFQALAIYQRMNSPFAQQIQRLLNQIDNYS